MRIVILNDFGFINGGASKVAITEALALADLGYKVTYFYAVGPLDSDLDSHPNIQTITTNDFDILHDPSRIRAAIKGIWNSNVKNKLTDLLQNCTKTDTVVHLHSWSKGLTSVVSKVVTELQFPFICTLHDYFLACPNGGFYKYPKKEICHFSPLSLACIKENCDARNYSHKIWRVLRSITQKTFGKLPNPTMNFIFVSEFSKTILSPFIPEGSGTYILDNPIQTAKEAPVQVKNNHAFVYVGRLSPEKGCQTIAEASIGKEYEIIYVGDGSERKKILDINPKAIITGWASHKDVNKYLNNARALIAPSLCYETHGLTIFEAFAKGIPVIVSNRCAGRDYVLDGVNGVWFSGSSSKDLQRKLDMLSDENYAAKLGRAAYERYWKNPLTIENHVQRLLSIYDIVLSNHKNEFV